MNDETTSRLNEVLKQIDTRGDTETFIKNHVLPPDYSFSDYLQSLISKKGITTAELTSRSGISKNYVYQIINGTRKNPGRDKVIALCIAAEATYFQINRALAVSKLGVLYPKDERDVRIAVAVNNRIFDITKINLMLDENGFAPLDI